MSAASYVLYSFWTMALWISTFFVLASAGMIIDCMNTFAKISTMITTTTTIAIKTTITSATTTSTWSTSQICHLSLKWSFWVLHQVPEVSSNPSQGVMSKALILQSLSLFALRLLPMFKCKVWVVCIMKSF